MSPLWLLTASRVPGWELLFSPQCLKWRLLTVCIFMLLEKEKAGQRLEQCRQAPGVSLSSSHVAHKITAKARLGPPPAWFKNRKFRLFWRHDHAVSWTVFLLYQTVVETISCLSLLCVSVHTGPITQAYTCSEGHSISEKLCGQTRESNNLRQNGNKNLKDSEGHLSPNLGCLICLLEKVDDKAALRTISLG